MYQIAITPVPVWVFGLLLTAALVYIALFFRRPVPFGWALGAILLAQYGAAFAALAFTAMKSIASEACLTGFIGSFANIGLMSLAVLAVLVASVVKRGAFLRPFAFYLPVVATIALAQAVILMVLLRSVALCSV